MQGRDQQAVAGGGSQARRGVDGPVEGLGAAGVPQRIGRGIEQHGGRQRPRRCARGQADPVLGGPLHQPQIALPAVLGLPAHRHQAGAGHRGQPNGLGMAVVVAHDHCHVAERRPVEADPLPQPGHVRVAVAAVNLGLLVGQPAGGPHLAQVLAAAFGGGDHQHAGGDAAGHGSQLGQHHQQGAYVEGLADQFRILEDLRDQLRVLLRSGHAGDRHAGHLRRCRGSRVGPRQRAVQPGPAAGQLLRAAVRQVDVGHHHRLARRRGLDHHRAVGVDDLALARALESLGGNPERLSELRGPSGREQRADLVGRRHPHPVLRGPHRNVQAGLVAGEGVEAVAQQPGAAHRKGAGRLEGHAVHARVEPDRPEDGVGHLAGPLPRAQMGPLVAHEHLLVGGCGDLAVGVDQHAGDRHPAAGSGHGHRQGRVDAVVGGPPRQRAQPVAVQRHGHRPAVVGTVVDRQVVAELGQHGQLSASGRGRVEHPQARGQVGVDVGADCELRGGHPQAVVRPVALKQGVGRRAWPRVPGWSQPRRRRRDRSCCGSGRSARTR